MIRDLESRHFDFLVAVLFDQHFNVKRCALLPFEVVTRFAFRQEHVNGWVLPIRDALWIAEGAVDLSANLQVVQRDGERLG